MSNRRPDGGEWLDLLLIVALPIVLLVVFVAPPETKRQLALDYSNPTVVTAFTSHFVHFSRDHLLTNLVGGAVVVPTGYLLSRLSGRRRQFLAVFTCFVFAFPFLLSGLNLLFARSAVGVGFSGIIMAFVGYLGIALMDFVGVRYDAAVDGSRSVWLFFLGLALVTYDVSTYGPPLALASLLASVLFVRDLVEELAGQWIARVRDAVTRSGSELTVLGTVVFLVYPAISIPANPRTASGLVNIYSHALGFCLGYIVTYITLLIGGFD